MIRRRDFIEGLGGAAIALGLGGAPVARAGETSGAPGPDTAGIAASRAQAAWEALARTFSVPRQPGLFFGPLQERHVASVWSHSQILHAALDLALLSRGGSAFQRALQGLRQYKLAGTYTAYAPSVHPGPNAVRFWDDNGMVGLALMQASYQTDRPERFLDMVKEIWPFIVQGQAKDGGVFWKERDAQPNRGISATGSTSELALRLHIAAGHPDRETAYFAFARLNERWLDAHLRAPQGYYWNSWYQNPADNPTPPGNVCRWMFTYNQGMPIGMDVLFFRITHDRAYLERAAAAARAALDYFTADRLWKQPPPFNAIFFRNLVALGHFAHDPRYRLTLEACLDRVWTQAREPGTGLFRLGGIGVYDAKTGFGSIDQAAFVQMFALLAWPAGRVEDLT